jgi:hypothetical protein
LVLRRVPLASFASAERSERVSLAKHRSNTPLGLGLPRRKAQNPFACVPRPALSTPDLPRNLPLAPTKKTWQFWPGFSRRLQCIHACSARDLRPGLYWFLVVQFDGVGLWSSLRKCFAARIFRDSNT